jgi:quercetin dioxygenase-like cupin family protein
MAFIVPIVAQENTLEIQYLNLKKIEKKKFSDRIFRQILVGEQGNIAVYELKKGADIPEHQHPQEQFTYIQKGKVEITIQNQKKSCKNRRNNHYSG